MLIDTHCHLNFPKFRENWREIIDSCLKKNIWLINVGCDLETSGKAVEIAENFPKGVFGAVGIHPTEIKDRSFDFGELFQLGSKKEVVAIGEIGFDFWHQPFSLSRQKRELKKLLELALKLKKPIIFHLRSSRDGKFDAYQIAIDLLKNYSGLRAVVHSFEGSLEQGEWFLERGFYLGVNGLLTRSKKVAKVVKKIPLERIILETDAPYLLPSGAEGKVNTPCNVLLVAEKLARLKKIGFDKISRITTMNAKELFGI